jgi:protein O-GlcNAc transferase
MTKVISFSLWGDNPKYTIGAIKNAELSQQIYPSWLCYFFVGNSVPDEIINKLALFPNVRIIHKNEPGDWSSMFWRFETSYDESVEISIFRDTDSRLSLREKNAVDEWLQSDKTFHIMRDHPFHRFPILGGMWGYKYNPIYDMKSLISNFAKSNQYGTDYQFFYDTLYPIIKTDKIVHDPFFDKIPFPSSRNGQEFVGEIYDENNVRHPEHYRYIPCNTNL